jgi:hypothetical protein
MGTRSPVWPSHQCYSAVLPPDVDEQPKYCVHLGFAVEPDTARKMYEH